MTLQEKVVKEAESFLNTPWHHEARIKGAGIDCGMFLLEVGEAVGAIPHIQPDHYPPDFMCHRNETWFLDLIMQYCDEVFEPPYLPGDIVMFKHGRIFSHSGFVIDWPKIIHASAPDKCVCYADISLPSKLSEREKRFFRYRESK